MLESLFDNEVEKYLGFMMPGHGKNEPCSSKFSVATPGRIKRRASEISARRPTSACAIFSPETRTPSKVDQGNTGNKIYGTPCGRKSKQKKDLTHCRTNVSSPLKTPKTPKESDRFICPRRSMNFESCHHKIMKIFPDNTENNMEHTPTSSTKNYESIRFQQGMKDNITNILGDTNNTCILQYQARGFSPLKQDKKSRGNLCNSTFSPCKRSLRKISLIPERVLDAPNYVDDYYLNLLHWSPSVDLVAVALDKSVYVWTPSSGDINHLFEIEETSNYVTSVQWIEQGGYLAVGTHVGIIQLWDVQEKKRLRQITSHTSRVGCLSWNSHLLSSGDRNGDIRTIDVRQASPFISSLRAHTQEVCGLKWSPSGRYLASGSNDNKINIWESSQICRQQDPPERPIHSFSQHTAAVKALAWCPWQHNILASGGGFDDKSIRFWNVNSGNNLNVVETDSQVSSLLWNETYKEIISGHGYPNNQLTIWQYPSMTKKADLLGHTRRVLQTTLSTDGTRVMSAAGDETLRLWNAFELTTDKKKECKKRNNTGGLISLSHLR